MLRKFGEERCRMECMYEIDVGMRWEVFNKEIVVEKFVDKI